MKVKIGVLGGIGPEATGLFYDKLINELQERGLICSNKDFPQIIVNSVPAPELVHEGISGHELKEYRDGLKELEKFGVDFIVMVCNTIHLYHCPLQKMIGTPIINLREELKRFLSENEVGSLLVLGTINTVKRGLYDFRNLKCFEPTTEELKTLGRAISGFNKGFNKKEHILDVKKICRKYLREGCDRILLGCTELAVMMKDENYPTVDTVDVLVNATISRFLTMKRLNKDG